MDAYQILILLCVLVIFSYLFDLFAKRTRIPSVLLLLVLGIAIRAAADTWVSEPSMCNFCWPHSAISGLSSSCSKGVGADL
ncbi:MAG: hypothetical protein IPO87_13165 [Flavobacteriales bacterium]|nr:hypothetical protein [Flavobacteriales bacterium]